MRTHTRTIRRQAAAYAALSASILLIVVACVSTDMNRDGMPGATYNASGQLIKPEGYREWIYIGAPLTPNDMNGGNAPFPEFHSVYIHPEAWEHYKANGTFLDGTILVKELASVGSKKATSGNGVPLCTSCHGIGTDFVLTDYPLK